MPQKRFSLSAKVSSDNPSAIKRVLESLIGTKGTIKSTNDGFEIQAEFEGGSARDLNRLLLSEMRKVEKRTRLRAEPSLTCHSNPRINTTGQPPDLIIKSPAVAAS